METYVINGKSVQYDTFDLEAMELLDMEIERVTEQAEAVNSEGLNKNNYIGVIREQCENVLDLFDTVLGEGTSEMLFGGKMNAKTIMTSYRQFVADVMKERASIGAPGAAAAVQPAPIPTNREQKRAAQREQRRQDAKKRVGKKGKANEG